MLKKSFKRFQQGFSLVELAVVLAVLGLLVGGVTGGRALVRTSDIRSLATDMGAYNSAVELFQNQYRALPGDMKNATAYWDAQDSTLASCVTTASTGAPTCDGNGDQKISGEGNFGGSPRYEIYRAWQQLANAGLISGKYTGVSGPGNSIRHSVPGTNTPKTRVGNAGFDFWYADPVSSGSDASMFDSTYGNMLILGQANSNDIAINGILKPEEAWNIDKKIDDGKPASGVIMTFKDGAWGNNCATATGYGVDRSGGACTLALNLHGVNAINSGTTPAPAPSPSTIAVNGGWTGWSAWSACTVSCGGGTQTQTRTCTNPSPANGGATCSGSGTQSQACNTATCAVNGVCGGSSNTCATPTAATGYSAGSCGGNQTWTCPGSSGGTNASCSMANAACSACSSPCGTTAHNASCTAYQAASVPYGSSCVSQSRTCNNGSLSGSYTNASCSVASAASCSSPCGTIAHNATCTAYAVAAPACGGSCTSETRTCNNGTLSGSYANASCSVAACNGCTSPCGNISHGGNCTAYAASSVAYGNSCTSETRNCSNGSLSGSYTNASCSVAAPASCSSPCGTLAHGESCSAYAASTVACGSSCSSQTRTCNNGSLSGSNAYGSCDVAACPASCSASTQYGGEMQYCSPSQGAAESYADSSYCNSRCSSAYPGSTVNTAQSGAFTGGSTCGSNGSSRYYSLRCYCDVPASCTNGACGGSAGTCSAGSVSGDNGQTACGTTRSWNCVGTNGGGTAPCSIPNAICPAGSCYAGCRKGEGLANRCSSEDGGGNPCATGNASNMHPTGVSNHGYSYEWNCGSEVCEGGDSCYNQPGSCS